MIIDPRHSYRNPLLFLVLICLLGLGLRYPMIGQGLPYFYDEDEAHHFNRVVNMVKSGDFNPHYFHKPSLHFYLRMPVVAASFLWSVKKGYLRTLDEIQTQDQYGIAKYAFTASHPGIVKWNRALGVGFGLGLIILAYLITTTLSSSRAAALMAALLTAVSPELVMNSAKIAVDIPMSFFCLWAAYLALRFSKKPSLGLLVFSGLVSGLAISTKYNALPIAFVPLAACLAAKKFNPGWLLAALLTPLAGFLGGSPYIFSSLPMFLNDFAYEIWHYGIEGHEGHMAQPGWPQAVFYLKWLGSSGLGVVSCLLAVVGIAATLKKNLHQAVVALLFPALFFWLMINQKANFTRNLLAIIPFVAIGSALGIAAIGGVFKNRRWARLFMAFLAAVSLVQPIAGAFAARRAAKQMDDSRHEAFSWLLTHQEPLVDPAVSGKLWLPPFTASVDGRSHYILKGAARVDPETKALELYQGGFDRLVLGPGKLISEDESEYLPLEKLFAGDPEAQRLVKNPEIRVYRFSDNDSLRSASIRYARKNDAPLKAAVAITDPRKSAQSPDDNPPALWITRRLSVLNLTNLGDLQAMTDPSGNLRLRLVVMTPWPRQKLTLWLPGWDFNWDFKDEQAGKRVEIELQVPYAKLQAQGGFEVRIAQVHSPLTQDLSSDSRRIGLAIESLSVSK